MPKRFPRVDDVPNDSGPLPKLDRHLRGLYSDYESEIKPGRGRTRDDNLFNPGSPRTIEKQQQGLRGSFKKGGKVKKTGIYKVHKGERVKARKTPAKGAKRTAARRRSR